MQQIDSNNLIIVRDSINLPDTLVAPEVIEKISLFGNHLLQSDSMELLPLTSNYFNSFFYWLVGISIIISITKLTFYKQFGLSLMANFSQRKYSQLHQLGSTIRHPMNVILLVVFVIATALFLSIISFPYVNRQIYTVNSLILQNSFIISGLLITSLSLAQIFKYLFQINDLISTYYSSIIQSYNIIAVGISIGIWFIIFSGQEVGVIIILVIMAILYTLRFYNLLINTRIKNKYSLLHYIIYLCTIEIIPLIIATKLYFIMVLEI